MHPRKKTKYFVKQHWEQEWISEAVQLARDVWQDFYKDRGSRTRTPSIPEPSTASVEGYYMLILILFLI
jgi:hypothetical protein